jgi:ethanolamine utilization cobalamin adenosyltransferase
MRFVTEAEIRSKIRTPETGIVLCFPVGTRFSPSAADFIKQWRMEIRFEESAGDGEQRTPPRPPVSFT